MKRGILLLSMLLATAGTAPASAAFLGANLGLNRSFPCGEPAIGSNLGLAALRLDATE